MTSVTTKPELSQPTTESNSHLFDGWFDPIETGIPALFALFGGAVGKDTVSRVWRKVKNDWDAWNARSLADEPIVRLILDGTVVRVRLDRKATSISLLVVRAPGRPESSPGDQANGRREHRCLAHRARRSHQARPAAARAPHR
jgi:hypothetical protein